MRASISASLKSQLNWSSPSSRLHRVSSVAAAVSAASQNQAGGTPAFTTIGPMGSRIQLQQRNCSRFARDFLRRSTFSSSQRTGSRSSGLRFIFQDLFINPQLAIFCVFN
jgi:hypothetical protein